MEFLDEDTRPRFLFQSGIPTEGTDPEADHKPSKPFLFLTISISSLLLPLSFLFLQSEPFRSLLFWFSLSLLIGPFAPNSITGGDIRVGGGPIVEFPDQETEPDKRVYPKRSKTRRSQEHGFGSVHVADDSVYASVREDRKVEVRGGDGSGFSVEQEQEWTEEDIGILRKQILKHPVGKPRRWEVIAEAFRGRHKLDSVIKKAKESGDKKTDDADSYAEFLKKRKHVDKRLETGNEKLVEEVGNGKEVGAGEGGTGWGAGEDIALLNALKAFPKDVPMRWEKIAAAVPGKSKAACMKRVAELKRDFRSAKAAADG